MGSNPKTARGTIYRLDNHHRVMKPILSILVPWGDPMTLRKKSTQTLSEQAYHTIKHAILRGEFPESSFLSEAEISKKYGIGHTPFREACNRLMKDQILEVVPRRGFMVPELSFRAVRDLLETRLILEAVSAELAATRAESREIKELERLYDNEVLGAKDRDNLDAIVEANREFHLQIARMTHNRELETLLRSIMERMERFSYLVMRSSQSGDAETLHKPILDAISKRDPSASHKAVVQDIARGQFNVFGRDIWASPDTYRERHSVAVK